MWYNRYFVFIGANDEFFAVSAGSLREAQWNAWYIDNHARLFQPWSYVGDELADLAERLGGLEVHNFLISEDY